MANRIKGITIEIDGNTKPLTKSLEKVDKSLKNTQSQLKDVNKLLKLDPTNVDLLKQKQTLLATAVKDTKTRHEELTKALEQMRKAGNTAENQAQQDALQRELVETTAKLKDLETQYQACSPQLEALSAKTGQLADSTKGLSTAAGIAAGGMIAMTVAAGQNADALLTDANVTGFSVEELQKLKYASDLVDVSYEDMTGSIQKLTKNMTDNNDAFDKLGISIYDENGKMRDATDVWYEAVEALGKVENGTERDQISMDLFGKSAMEMAGIVDDGGEKLRKLGQEAEDAGLIMSGDALEGAGQFNDALDELKATATQAFAKAGATLAETLIPMLEKLVGAVEKVLTWFANLDGTTQTIILTVLGLATALSPVLSLISTITTVLPALQAAFAAITGPVGLVVAAIAALVAAGVALYKNWDTVKAKAQEIWTAVVEEFENMKNGVVDKWNTLKNKAGEIFENMKNAIVTPVKNAVQTITDTWNSLKDGTTDIIESMKSTTVDKWNTLRDKASEIFKSIKSKITDPIANARDTIKGIVDKIKGFFDFTFTVPKLKLPHFSIKPSGWKIGDLLKGSIPKLGIDWYAKAMDRGMILDKPTIFGAQNGQLLAGGEAGREVVVGLNSLMGMIQKSVVNAQHGSGGINVTVNVNGNVSNYDALAETIGQKLQQQMALEGRTWA